MSLKPLLEFAVSLTAVADAEIIPLYQNVTVSRKPDGTEVTDADENAETALRKAIERRFPEHGILGEEHGVSASDHPHQWVIDPIDGTAWFTLGMPMFGTLIALLEHGEPVLGVVHFPALGETVYAAKGEGCWFKTRHGKVTQVRVARQDAIGAAIASASGAHGSDISLQDGAVPYQLTKLINEAEKFRFCTDCLQHALVCRGRVHVAVDTVMKPWDIAALVPCVEEAGGVVGNLRGERANILNGGSLVSACSEPLLQQVLEMLQPA